ncbi:hypothetical protein R4Z09_16585 [Niallia oryzisoli]|uniref:Lipoprotein n=1 Tax=Niallia oryzisoli TaxID=1737571 RepID=A0ABZ2C933_9BACI
MSLRIIFTVLLLFFVTACNSPNQASIDSTHENSYSREITKEEQSYIRYILNEDYEALISKTEDRKSEIKKDYYQMATALAQFEEAEERKQDPAVTNEELKLRYTTILQMLDKVKYIPVEIKDKVREVKKLSQFQEDYYGNKIIDRK